jgi:GntR family transcriptional regulator
VAGAKYKQIAEDLREQITAGTLRPGRQLPTEPQLAAAHDASRSTVRLAIGLLIQQGLVETRQGMGTFVTEPTAPLTVVLSREEDWQAGEPADAALQPTGKRARPTTATFQAETTSADAEVAAALNVAEGTPIMLRRTHRYLGKDPWSLIASYYPMDIVKGTALEQAASSAKSASLILAEHGHKPVGYRHDIYARMPDTIEAAFFQLPRPVPVTVVNRMVYDASQPVRLTRYVYRSDRLRLRHEMGSIPVT